MADLLLIIVALALSLFLSLLVSAQSGPPAQPAQQKPNPDAPVKADKDIRVLEPGEPIDRVMKGGESHTYSLTLESKNFLHAAVKQSGVDVVVTLFGPAGEKLKTVDLIKRVGTEPLSWVAEKRGAYRLEVRALLPRTSSGHYEIVSEVRQSATLEDRDRWAAEGLLIEAQELEQKGAFESPRQGVTKREEALKLWQKLADGYWTAYTLNGIGNLYLYSSLSQPEKALDYYNQALPLRRAANDKSGEAVTLGNIGALYNSLGEKQKALDYYNQALAVWRATDKSGEAATLGNIGAVYNSLGEKQKALDFFNQELTVRRSIGDHSSEAWTLNRIGWLYDSLGDKQKALEYINEAINLMRDADDKSAAANMLLGIARIYTSTSDKKKAFSSYKQSLDLYEHALALARSANDREGEAEALNNIGFFYSSIGKHEKAHEYANKALAVYQSTGNKVREGEVLTNVGYSYYKLGEKQKALESLNQSLALWQTLGNRYGTASVLGTIAAVYVTSGEKQKALDYYARAITLYRDLGNRTGEANTLGRVGHVYELLGEKEKALDAYNQALSLWRAVSHRSGEASALTSIGELYDFSGERQKALGFYSQALVLWRAVHNRRGESGTLIDLGFTYALLGDDRKALDFFNQALPLQIENNDQYGRALSLNGIGFVYSRLLHDNEKAIDFYSQALAQSQGADSSMNKSLSLTGLGAAYAARGDAKKALDYLNKALPLSQASGDPFAQAYNLHTLGAAYAAAKDTQKALDNYQRALPLWRIRFRDGEVETFSNLMSLWTAQRNARLAIFYGKQAVNVNQELRASIRELEQSSQKSFLKLRENTYRELADLLVSEGRLPEAQQVLGMLKEEEYFDFIRRDAKEAPSLTGRANLTPTEAEWEKRYKEIADQLTALGRERGELLANQSRTPAEEQRLSRLESDLRIAQEAFQKYLDQLFSEFGKSELAKERAFQLRESQGMMDDLRELGSGAVALYTLVGGDKYRVILVTSDVQKAFEYPIKDADLNRKVAAFREALQDPKLDPLPFAQELYNILVAPIAKDLEQAHAQTLMWSLDGVLRYIPIAALHDGKQYMVERYRNVVFTPASNSRLKDQPSSQWKALGLGVSKAQPGASALPNVPEELRSIIREEASGNSATSGVLPGTLLLDEAFTADAMKTALHRRYQVVHIASHFGFRPGDETKSFLLLGDGNRMSLAEIKTSSNLFGGVELLTLSACDTATSGAEANGKEVEGFGVLAQRQGAKAVVASLWPVEDESTRHLMQRFYGERSASSGMLKAEALRRAQLTLLTGTEKGSATNAQQRQLVREKKVGTRPDRGPFKSEPNAPYAHPYYWAPFILIGNWK